MVGNNRSTKPNPKVIATRERLVAAVRSVRQRPEVQEKIAALKRGASEFEREDFVWHKILCAMATLGGSRGVALIQNPEHYNRLRFEVLSGQPLRVRRSEILGALRAAGVRYPRKKTDWLMNNIDRVATLDGVAAAKHELERAYGVRGKIAFLTQFKGIGPKYARNVMMDVYHPEFRDQIAVDARITGITKALGLSFSSYEPAEDFYLSVAHAAGIEGWELDRLMYWFTDDIRAELGGVQRWRTRAAHL